MADPYHHDPSGQSRSYQGANAPHYGRPNYPQSDNLSRTDSFNHGDDADYFDGGTGVARRQSVQQQYPDEYYYSQESAQATSYSMADRTEPTGQYFAPQGNGNGQYRAPYSPGYQAPAYDPPQDSMAPYPTGPPTAYNGTQNARPQPYNPAAFPPQRHATSAGSYAQNQQQPDYRPQRHATTTGYSPQTTSYNPSTFAPSAPYPTSQTYSPASRPLPMPGASLRPQPSQSSYTGSYGSYSNNRPQYANASNYMSQNGQYSPGLPPVPTQSAPAQASYQPPPPPPPPIPPTSPGYNQTSYGSPSQYSSSPYTTGQTLSHTPSQMSHMSRPETHYNSGTESDNSGEAPHHPLPSPPKDRPLALREGTHTSQPLPNPPVPAPSSLRDRRPLPQVPAGGMNGDQELDNLYADVEASLMDSTHGEQVSSPIGPNGANGHFSGIYDDYYGNNDINGRDDLSRTNTLPSPPVNDDRGSDDGELDYAVAGMDLGMFGGGGFPGFYGGFGNEDTNRNELPTPPAPPPLESTRNYDSGSTAERSPRKGQFNIPDEGAEHPFPTFDSNTARVDTWGTGGLAEPNTKPESVRSYDEGDERIDDFQRADNSDEYIPELFYHPGPSSSATTSPNLNRPLPSPPSGDQYGTSPGSSLPYPDSGHQRTSSTGTGGRPTSRFPPSAASAFAQNTSLGTQGPYIPRATSMSAHSTTPVTVPPARSKTDGRVHPPKSNRASMIAAQGATMMEPQASPSLTPQDLPSIPLMKKFDPRKLSGRDLSKCTAPWALSAISAWLKDVTEGDQDLREPTVADAITRLFTHHVPTMKVADAETLATKIVSGMLKEKNLIKDEEWVKFGDGEVCGVIYQLTGSGCYSNKVHEKPDATGRCYSHHCQRTERKMQLSQTGEGAKEKMEDWATFWKIKVEDIADVNKKEVERQNNIHEIVQTEEEYMEQLRVLKTVYMDQIRNANPPIIKPTKIESFVRDVFAGADAVRKVSEEHLLPQLKFRQREQGPWVVGFSDIFREWIRKAKKAYLDYASGFPKADMLVRKEAERNLLFRQFLEQCRQDPRTKRLDWVTFLKGPITRLQRYSLLLFTVLKNTTTETEEKHNLERAIEEIKAVTLDCDARVDEMSKHVKMIELESKLIMREWGVKLRLEEKGRELIFQGELQRTGRSNRFTWLETHCILFDHYLILAKTIMQKEGAAKQERYDVSRMPIPMDLLLLESVDDDPVVRGTASKLGISSPAATARVDNRSRHNTLNTVPTLQHAASSTSVSSTATAPGRLVTTIDQGRDERVLYPFRIKHLRDPMRPHPNGKIEDNTYILYAHTAKNRQDWCERIIFAKEKHAASLHAQNAEPFKLKVIADTAFAYDASTPAGPKPIRIRGTPLDRAITEVEKQHESLGPRPNPVCRATVNCATAFTTQTGKQMVAIGTDFGVFISEAGSCREWHKAINTVKVTQLAVLEEFSLFLVLADKALVAYHLDIIIPPAPTNPPATTKPRPPQRLSGAKDVGFFATGRMKDRTLVFYKKRENLSSTFKVLEPVLQRNTEKRSRFSRKGTTDFFREFDDFYIPTECFGINLFQSSLSIQTSKGFEVMTLDKKQPFSVPELKASHVTATAARLQNQKPLGMFRLSDIEFLLCYEECAVYVNKHGDVSRSVIMEFVGRAKTVALFGVYVLVFDADFVEVRNAENGRLRQVIAGRDMRCIDDAGSYKTAAGKGGEGRGVKVALAHPDVEGRQLVVELVLNEGQMD